MAELLDNCRFEAGSAGTADFVDGTAVPGCRNLLDAGAVGGETYPYKAQNATATQWERGYGTYDASGGTLSRDDILDSSDGGSKVDFSVAPQIIISPTPAELDDGELHPEQFGAAGDGVTDDAPAWRAMLDYGIAHGRTVFRGKPGATYLFDSTDPDDVGENSAIARYNLECDMTFHMDGAKIALTQNIQTTENATTGMRFTVNSLNTYPYFFRWYGGEINLEQCDPSAPGGWFVGGMSLTNWHMHLEGAFFNHGVTEPDGDDIGVGGGDQSVYINLCKSAAIQRCTFRGAPDQGIYASLTPGAFLKITNNHFERCARAITFHASSPQYVVADNTILECGLGFTTLASGGGSSNGGIISGNYFKKTFAQCLRLDGDVNGCLISGNRFEDWSRQIEAGGEPTSPGRCGAIRIYGDRNIVSNNIMRMNDWAPTTGAGVETTGIEIRKNGSYASAGAENLVFGNIVDGARDGFWVQSGCDGNEEWGNRWEVAGTKYTNNNGNKWGLSSLSTYNLTSSVLPNVGINSDGRLVRTPDVLTMPLETVTISGGVAAITKSRVLIDTEASAASDDLDTINVTGGNVAGMTIVVSTVNSSRDVVLKNNTGNILLATGGDVTLSGASQRICFQFTGTHWVELFRSF
jgi:hypothetical protein